MNQKKSMKIKDLVGLGLQGVGRAGNTVQPDNPFIPFAKEEIEQSIPGRFTRIVAMVPDQIAVSTEQGTITYSQLNQQANQIAHTVLSLYDERTRLSDAEIIRYQRQMRLSGWGMDAQEKLKGTTVFVAGAGGSASPLVMQLALVGIGTIIIADDDVVELSNLNRQVLHDESRIGMNKALSAQQTVARINPHVRVLVHEERITAANVSQLVGDATVIFDNVDDIEAKFCLSRCAVEKGIPHILSSMMDMDAYVALFCPPHGPCYHCLYDAHILDEIAEIKKIRTEQPETTSNEDHFTNPVAAPALFLAAGFAVNEALKIVLNLGKPSYNRFFFFDQRGVSEILPSMGYRQIIYPFNAHFKELSRAQGFDWEKGGSDRFVQELMVTPDPDCPLCRHYTARETTPTVATQNRSPLPELPVPADPASANRAVALLFSPGLDMIPAILGVLKTGMIYVPLDASYPIERLLFILADSGARVVVTHSLHVTLAHQLVHQVNSHIAIVNTDMIPATVSCENPYIPINPASPAYILYTSGSTGKPKGVVQNHRNVLFHASVYTNALHIEARDRLTLFSSYSFDAAKMDIYGALLNGATLYPYDIKQTGYLQQLPQWLRTQGITIYHSIPTVYRYFVDLITEPGQFPALRLIVLGGEAVFKKDIDQFKRYFSPHCILINGLGPTESTLTMQYFMDMHTTMERDAVPVGFPVADTEVFIINEHGGEAGVLGVGEMIFKSQFLAVGYWKNPTLTAKVFGPDPITGEGRVYHSGDLGRRLPDGAIEFVGRNDFQVKIRGYRVELGEIESKLDLLPGIKKSIVVCRQENSGENYLVAYYTTSREQHQQDLNFEKELIETLKTLLPDYMVPAIFLFVQEFPLTATGKIDRKTLAQQEVQHLLRHEEKQAPANETESLLLLLWQEVLKQDSIGVNEHFFLLGGNSIKAILLVSRILKEFRVKLSLVDIFKHPTIQALARVLKQLQKQEYYAIAEAEKREYYPLTSAQKRIFLASSFEEAGLRFNIPVSLCIRGGWDHERYVQILFHLFRRHETLCTSFHFVNEEPVQRVHEFSELSFALERIPQPYSSRSEELSVAVLRQFLRPFDLARAPLCRVAVFSATDDVHYLFFDIHHIIFDGTSMDVLVRDFIRLYHHEHLAPLSIQYRDFALWQNALYASNWMQDMASFWLNLYADVQNETLHRLVLPYDFPRPPVMDYQGEHYRFALDVALSTALKKLAVANNVSLFMLLLAIYSVFLSKLSGASDIIVGTVTAGRNHPDTEALLGVFINMLALRNQPLPGKTFTAFLTEVGQATISAFENRDYPFEVLVEQIPGSRDAGHHPLLDVGFTLQNTGMAETATLFTNDAELQLLSLKEARKTARNDLNLEGFEIGDHLELEFQYRTSLFKRETMIRWAGYFKTLIAELVATPSQTIEELHLLTSAEMAEILDLYNQSEAFSGNEKTVVAMFAEQVAHSPAQVAVYSTIACQNIYDRLVAEDVPVQISFEELNEYANRLAHYLRFLGVGPDRLVGLMVQHPLEKVVGIWGILKAGGAYLPIDPLYPSSVIQDILHDSQVAWLVAETNLMETLELLQVKTNVIMIDELDVLAEQPPCTNPELLHGVTDLAYIIYTSGTTGRAKGTAIEHRGIANYARWRIQYFNFTRQDVTLQPLTYSFDSFCANFYAPLLAGGSLVMVPDNRRLDFNYIVTAIRTHHVTTVCFAPGLYNVLLDTATKEDLQWFRVVVLAGEACTGALLEKSLHKAPHITLANEYGPTEVTVDATCFSPMTPDTTAIIGSPIANTRIYILDHQLKPVLPGVSGEICIAGVGVARGYLNNPELTAERFVFFTVAPGSQPQRVYRSGDLGRWILSGPHTGAIEFLGRQDQQVKIRGHRIELAHIENQLLNHETVKEVLVDVRGEGDNRYICAYIITHLSAENNLSLVLKEWLRERLPYYMVPTHIIPIAAFPLTRNGKIDRRALPDNESYESTEEYVAPTTPMEHQVAGVLAEVLQIEQVGSQDNLFDIGGNSLNLVQASHKLKTVLDRDVPVVLLFQYPSVRKLCAYLASTSQATAASGTNAETIIQAGEQLAETLDLFEQL